MKVKKNDTVLVLSGKDAGKTAKVLVAIPKANKVVVDGVNVQYKHKKARSAQDVSSIEKQSGPIDASNVLVVCPVCNKAVRVKYDFVEGKKVRVCRKCNALLDTTKEAKEAAKTSKKKAKKTAEEKPAEKKTSKSKKAAKSEE